MKLLWLTLILVTSGCTTTILEVASVPSTNPWGSVPDTKVYKYNKGLDNIIEFSDLNLSLSLTNYETKYRGFAILGIEMERWPDDQFFDDKIILALGVKPLKMDVELIANNIGLIMKVDGFEQYFIKPYKVMKFDNHHTKFCGFDNSFDGWGTHSVELGDKTENLYTGSKFVDNCYNVYFKLPKKVKDVNFALDFTNSLLPMDNHKVIYFHKKLIKWISSN